MRADQRVIRQSSDADAVTGLVPVGVFMLANLQQLAMKSADIDRSRGNLLDQYRYSILRLSRQ